MHKVYIEIGGNEGNRLDLIKQTKQLIALNIGSILKESSIYETPPWGFVSNSNFYNQVLLISTSLAIEDLIENTQKIELKLGRVRDSVRFVSRTVDIDILFYGNEVIDLPNIHVPHPRIQERKFVLVPLAELNENFIHPKLNRTIKYLLENCIDNAKCHKLDL